MLQHNTTQKQQHVFIRLTHIHTAVSGGVSLETLKQLSSVLFHGNDYSNDCVMSTIGYQTASTSEYWNMSWHSTPNFNTSSLSVSHSRAAGLSDVSRHAGVGFSTWERLSLRELSLDCVKFPWVPLRLSASFNTLFWLSGSQLQTVLQHYCHKKSSTTLLCRKLPARHQTGNRQPEDKHINNQKLLFWWLNHDNTNIIQPYILFFSTHFWFHVG